MHMGVIHSMHICIFIHVYVHTYTHNMHSPSNQIFSLKILLLHHRHNMINLFWTLNTCSTDCQTFHLILGNFLELMFCFFLALKTLQQQRTKRENWPPAPKGLTVARYLLALRSLMQENHVVVSTQSVTCKLHCLAFDQEMMQSGSEAAGQQGPRDLFSVGLFFF